LLNKNNHERAYLEFQKASQKNYPTAHICFAFYKFYLLLPTEINEKEAQKLVLMAGENGDAYCAKFVAKFFEKGRFGFSIDATKQSRFLNIASRKETFESSIFYPLCFIQGYIGLLQFF
jgi:hypothetical protein